MEAQRSLRSLLLILGKVSLAAGILAFLIYSAHKQERFAELVEGHKNWTWLFVGFLCAFVSVALSFIRWRLLVVALGIEFSVADALRLGSMGYALNFVSPGNLGGDLIKAVFLARGNPGRRTEAVATVAIDRLMGLGAMLVLASIGIVTSGLLYTDSAALKSLCWAILAAAACGLVIAGSLIFLRPLTGGHMIARARTIPLVGSTAARLLAANRTYRDQKPLLARAALLSLVVDLLYVVSFYLVAQGLPFKTPTLQQHLIIVPVATLAGAIPGPPGGLGTLEGATEVLYRSMPGVEDGVGTIVTLAYRLTTVVVAAIGLVFYILYRAEVRDVIAAEEQTRA